MKKFLAVIIFSAVLAMNSFALAAGLMKQIYFWYAGMAVGAFGIFNFITTMSMV